jgi:Protein of unknown function (DUF2510)
MSTPRTPSEPGWYDDPDGRRNIERYWNGDSWSGAPRSRPPELKGSVAVLMVVGVVVLAAVAWWIWIGF